MSEEQPDPAFEVQTFEDAVRTTLYRGIVLGVCLGLVTGAAFAFPKKLPGATTVIIGGTVLGWLVVKGLRHYADGLAGALRTDVDVDRLDRETRIDAVRERFVDGELDVEEMETEIGQAVEVAETE